MSHIQIELDVLNIAGAVATAAKVARQWIVAGLNDMWAHCFRVKSDEVNDILIAGFFSEPIGPVLEAFGFLERVGDGVWRVRGTDRYTSLTERRKAAGSKGGKATQANRNGSSKSTVAPAKINGATEAKDKEPAFAQANEQQRAEKGRFAKASAQATVQANPQVTVANQALYPRSEISSPYGEERSRRDGRSARRFRQPAPAPDGARATKREDIVDPPPPPRPPKPPPLKPGTPEYDQAVREDDWEALGWEPMR